MAVASPIEAQAKANYAQNPIPQISPADFKVKGGLLFADGDRLYVELQRDGIIEQNQWQTRLTRKRREDLGRRERLFREPIRQKIP